MKRSRILLQTLRFISQLAKGFAQVVLVCLAIQPLQGLSAESDVIFRARGHDYVITNPFIKKVNDLWTEKKSDIESTWKSTVDAFRITIDFGIGTYTLGAENTAVTISGTLPAFTLMQGTTSNSLTFSTYINVSWSTHFCAPWADTWFYDRCGGPYGIDSTMLFDTKITISGSAKFDHDSEKNKYYLQVTNIKGTSLSTLFYGLVIDPKVEEVVKAILDTDANNNQIADVKEPFYLDDLVPDPDQLFPIYTYLAAGGKFPFTLEVVNGTPVIKLATGDPIPGDWLPYKTDHPRLLYTAEERPLIMQKMQSNFLHGWYDNIKSLAQETPVFPTSTGGVISEDDWANKEVKNAHIALSAALVRDLEGDQEQLHNALRILFRFTDTIADPLFSYQWGQNGLYASETLLTLCQAYDLVLGSGFPRNVSREDIQQNKLDMPLSLWLRTSVEVLLSFESLETARTSIQSYIEEKFKSLRDVIHLETHAWDIAGSPNHSIRNASALGISAILFNDDPTDAYENISLATTTIWKRLGIATSLPFNDVTNFTKSKEGEGYAEGPHYLDYAAELYLPFMWAYNKFIQGEDQNQGFIYNDWANRYPITLPNLLTTERVQKAHEWSLKISLPDGSRPNIKDSNKGESFYTGLLANAKATPDPVLQTIWAWDFERNNFPTGNRLVDNFVEFDDTLLTHKSTPSSRYPTPSLVMEDAGSVVFRSGWDNQATYMHILADHNWTADGFVGGMRIPYHQQDDNSSFVIHAFGEDLAIDAGYGNFPVRGLVANANNHNVVLVDGKGASESAEATIDRYLLTPYLGYAQISMPYVKQDGQLMTTLERHALFVDNRYFIIVDDLASAGRVQYDWQLHGRGNYEQFNQTMMWTTPSGKQLQAIVTNTSSGGVDSIVVDNNSPDFEFFTSNPNDVKHHTAISAREYNANKLRYLAALLPGDGVTPVPTATTFSDDLNFSGIRLESPKQTDILLVKYPSIGENEVYTVSGVYTGVQEISTDAQLVLITISKTLNRVSRLFVRDGGTFLYGGRSLINSQLDIISSYVNGLLKVTGDVNGDFVVDKIDVQLIMKHIGQAADGLTSYDLDFDGKITVLDARLAVNLCNKPLCAQ